MMAPAKQLPEVDTDQPARMRIKQGEKSPAKKKNSFVRKKEDENTSGSNNTDKISEKVSCDKAEDEEHDMSAEDDTDNVPSDVSNEDVIDEDTDLQPDIVDNLSPMKALEEAFEEQRLSQKEAYHKLIDDNVILRRQMRKQEYASQEQEAKYQVKCVELEAEQGKSAHLENDVTDMRNDMKALIIANKRRTGHHNNDQYAKKDVKVKGKKGKQQPATGEHEVYEKKTINVNNDESPMEEPAIGHPLKLSDLETRMIRLTEEDERKSRRLISIERELNEKRIYIEKLERHVDNETIQQLSNDNDMSDRGFGYADNVVYAGKPETYSYRKNVVHDSTVCVIS